jgi:protoheme IX farnesyltransferase
MKFRQFSKILFELGKVRISLPVALSALTGYAMFAGQIDSKGWLMALGVFFFSAGSGALNHYQEREIDALMPRTRNRPIPSERITAKGASAVALSYVLIGSFFMLLTHSFTGYLLCAATFFSYNFVYTPLKKVTAFAVVPGSIIGALPPLIGWATSGGNIIHHEILLVALFFFIGQIPHFWILLLMFGEQYQLAGLPSLNQVFSEAQIKRVTFTWILTTSAAALLVLFYVFRSHTLMFILLIYVFYLLISFSVNFLVQKQFHTKAVFYKLNFLYLFMMIFLIIDGLIRNGGVQG